MLEVGILGMFSLTLEPFLLPHLTIAYFFGSQVKIKVVYNKEFSQFPMAVFSEPSF